MEKIVKGVKRLDSNTYAEFDKDITEAASGDCDRLVVDLADTQYISSICLRVLLKGFKQMRAKGGEFVLRSVQPTVLEVLVLGGFLRNFYNFKKIFKKCNTFATLCVVR